MCVPSTGVGFKHLAVRKTGKFPTVMEFTFSKKRTDKNRVKKILSKIHSDNEKCYEENKTS